MWYTPHSKENLNCTAINIPEVPNKFRIELLYNGTASNFDLIVSITPHSFIPPPRVPEAHICTIRLATII